MAVASSPVGQNIFRLPRALGITIVTGSVFGGILPEVEALLLLPATRLAASPCQATPALRIAVANELGN